MAVLPDLLAPGLRLVVCGSAVGARSAQVGAYYAGPGNRFWPMLARVGLTPAPLRPDQYPLLLDHGIGLTDIVKNRSGADSTLRPTDFDRARLHACIARWQPRLVAFNGKRAASAFFGHPVAYGYQAGRDIFATRMYVAPSTSGAARGFWDESVWQEIARSALL